MGCDKDAGLFMAGALFPGGVETGYSDINKTVVERRAAACKRTLFAYSGVIERS